MTKSAEDRVKEHLVRSLRADPLWQSDEVLASRAAALGLETAAADRSTLAADAATEKASLRAALDEIRKAVLDTPADETFARLDQMPLERHPELLATAERLRAIAAASEEAAGLAEHNAFDAEFYRQLQRVLTSDPNKAAAVREHVAWAVSDKALRRRGVRMVKLIRNKAPRLYAVEAEWLGALLRRRQPLRLVDPNQAGWNPPVPVSSGRSVPDTEGGHGCLWWLIGLAVLHLIGAVAGSG